MKRLVWLPWTALPLAAHEGEPLAPHDLWTAWECDPLVVMGLTLTAWAYWREATPEHGFRPWERACFWAGWWSLVVALISPLHPLGSVLFSAHMAQHEILMAVSGPLLVLGRPLVPLLWILPAERRRSAGRLAKLPGLAAIWTAATKPLGAWLIHFALLWAWHIPSLFEATLRSELVHSLQHISFLGSALLFWWALLHGHGARRQYGGALVYVFTTMLHTGILGAMLTFARTAWYGSYAATTQAWGLTPIEDQQLGGLIMWVPAGLTYLAAVLLLFVAMLRESDRQVIRAAEGAP